MELMSQRRLLFRITRSQDIARRYFVVNGFDGALTIIFPLWLAIMAATLPFDPLGGAIFLTFVNIFLLGILLGKVSGTFWLLSGLRTLLIGFLNCLVIYRLSPH